MRKHPELFGINKQKILTSYDNFHMSHLNSEKEINTEKLVFWTETTLTRIIEEFYSFILQVNKSDKENINLNRYHSD